MKTYTIREISEMFHLPASTIRYYEDAGILTNVERTATNQRIYYEKHINRMKSVCCFKRTGMSIAQLQDFYSYEQNEPEHITEILTLLENQKNQVETQLEELNQSYSHIKRKLAYYHAIESAIKKDQPLPDWSEYKYKSY